MIYLHSHSGQSSLKKELKIYLNSFHPSKWQFKRAKFFVATFWLAYFAIGKDNGSSSTVITYVWYTLLDWPFFIIRTTSSRGENHYYCFVKWWTSVVGFLLADSTNLRTIFYLDGKHTYGGWDTINSQEISNQKREAITRLFTILSSCKKYLSIHYAFTMKNHDVFSLALPCHQNNFSSFQVCRSVGRWQIWMPSQYNTKTQPFRIPHSNW